jgi:hypothetical protein
LFLTVAEEELGSTDGEPNRGGSIGSPGLGRSHRQPRISFSSLKRLYTGQRSSVAAYALALASAMPEAAVTWQILEKAGLNSR